MKLYADASGLVKLLLAEEGWETMEELWSAAATATSAAICYTEARSALAAARRSTRLSAGGLSHARRELERRWEQLVSIEIDAALTAVAGDVAEAFALRALDAVHLAAALTIADRDLLFVTWDRSLSEAAQAAGLAVAP